MLKLDIQDAAFVSWPYDPDDLRAHVPDRLRLDLYDGAAWVTVIVFDEVFRPPGLRCAELNVRTYVRGGEDEPSLWFLRVEVSNPIPPMGMRLLGLPAHATGLHPERAGARRRWVADTGVVDLTVGAPLDPVDPLADWLAMRYYLHDPRGMRSELRHEPWPLHAATARCDDSVLTAAGLKPPAGEPHAMWSPGVAATLVAPRPAPGMPAETAG